MESIATPHCASAFSSVKPLASVRPRSAAIVCVPANAEEPKRLRPKRAPSSSAQSTRRTVTGGLPLYSLRDSSQNRRARRLLRVIHQAVLRWAQNRDGYPGSASEQSPRGAWSSYCQRRRNGVRGVTRVAVSETILAPSATLDSMPVAEHAVLVGCKFA